ncbi:MAG: hypothetical protein FWF82_07925, partial [Oscillospiraceae bacterium]|nr:hypothetical protein [Oscillospiraceae bacterium]
EGLIKFGNFYCDAGKAMSYRFRIMEIAGDAIGVTYDETVLDVLVEIKDVDGELVGMINVEESDKIAFTNVAKQERNPGMGVVIITSSVVTACAVSLALVIITAKKRRRAK